VSAKLRPFRPEDTAEIQRIIREVFEGYGVTFDLPGFDNDLTKIAEKYRGPDHAFFTLVEGKKVVGCIGGTDQGEEGIEIHRLYIDVKVRGKGYGKLLLEHLLAWARSRGKKRMFLWSDVRFAHAHALYEKHGFRRSLGERVCDDIDKSHEYGFERAL
jgi:GNAT superfamily N-acetyltransferase